MQSWSHGSKGRSYRATAAAGLGAAGDSGAALRTGVVHFRGELLFLFGNRGKFLSFDDCAFGCLSSFSLARFVLKSSEMRSKLNAVSSAAGLHACRQASKNARSLVREFRPPELSLSPLPSPFITPSLCLLHKFKLAD